MTTTKEYDMLKMRFPLLALLCSLALLLPHHAKADTCQSYTGTPPTSSNPDGSMLNLTCNKQGQLALSGGSTTDNQGAPNTNANGWPVKITDGTNVLGTSSFPLYTQPASPASASILVGRQSFTSTTGATTLITITAGKTFTGTIGASVSCNEAAAGTTACQATAAFTTVGAGTTPAAGAIFDCDARSGANVVAGTVGSQSALYCSIPISVNCSTGTCTVAVASTNAGTASIVTATASGTQQ